MGSDAPSGVSGGVSRDGEGPSREVTVADKLRTLADWLDAHPAAVVHQIDFMAWDGKVDVYAFGARSGSHLAERASAIGGLWEKRADEGSGSDIFRLRQEIMPGFRFDIVASRDQVCERVVVGEREVEVPDPDAPLVTVTEEVVEYRCGPLLGQERAA